MGLFGDYAGPEFGLDDVKIATWNSNGVYGTAVDVPSVQMYTSDLKTVSAELEGDDQITDTHAIGISADIRVKFGSISLEAYEVLTGITSVESTDSPGSTGVKTFDVGNVKFPYIGICGKSYSTQDAGDTQLFIPKCKIMEGFNVGMQYGQYAIPEITLRAVKDSVYNCIMRIVKHQEAVAVTLPPFTGDAP